MADGTPILREPSADWAVYRVNYANPRGTADGKAYTCYICGKPFRESDIRTFRGIRYGVPCLHHLTIGSILRQEAAQRYVPDSSGESPAAQIIVSSTETPD